jgi:PAS domain S-box-containing protein
MPSLLHGDGPNLRFGIESLPSAAYVCAPDARIVSYNAAATALWGHTPTPQDICCLNIQWLDDDGAPVGHEGCPVESALARRNPPCVGRGVLPRSGQSPLSLEIASAPFFDRDGVLQGVLNLMRPLLPLTDEIVQRDAQLLGALDAADVSTFDWDLGSDMVSRSSNARRILGGLPTAGPRAEFERHVHPDDLVRLRTAMDDARQRNQVVDVEYRVVALDGSVIWLSERARVIRGPDDRPLRIIGARMDVTRRHQVQEGLRVSEERLRVALEAARLGSWALDLTTGAFTASGQCKANLGLPPEHDARYEEDVLQPIVNGHQQAFRQLVADTMATGGSFQVEVPTRWPDGSDRWLLIAGRAIDPASMVGVSLDVTERKDAQHRIADINRRKDEFIATLGHELRQPIAPMAMALRVLGSDPTPDASKRAQDILTRQLDHLTRLVDDLVDSARVAQGKVTLVLELITLQDVLSNAANVAAPEMSHKQLQFDIEMPPEPVYVRGDMSRLQQVFSNLLLNAAKFTDEGGRVRVRLTQENEVSRIEVRDTGRGVAPEVRSTLFDMFMQADTTTGLGIGLPVVKRLVELHGGSVDVTFTSPGAGSEFTVTLPLASVARQ